jgi:ubiquinone/menaquinone biosynthesis C-methylase UbiE
MNTLATSTVGVEVLDDPGADPRIVEATLRNIARSNRWFGGRAAVRFGLARALDGLPPGRVTLVDVGTGAGDLARDAEKWGRSRGFVIRGLGLDRAYPAARMARDGGVTALVGCAGTLPFGDRSVDLVLVSQVLHHLTGPAAVRLLQESGRVARRAVIVCDLKRAVLAQAGFWIGSRVLFFDSATRADGITSVRRGYSARQLGELMQAAGMPSPIWTRPGYRLVGVWQRK